MQIYAWMVEMARARNAFVSAVLAARQVVLLNFYRLAMGPDTPTYAKHGLSVKTGRSVLSGSVSVHPVQTGMTRRHIDKWGLNVGKSTKRAWYKKLEQSSNLWVGIGVEVGVIQDRKKTDGFRPGFCFFFAPG